MGGGGVVGLGGEELVRVGVEGGGVGEREAGHEGEDGECEARWGVHCCGGVGFVGFGWED